LVNKPELKCASEDFYFSVSASFTVRRGLGNHKAHRLGVCPAVQLCWSPGLCIAPQGKEHGLFRQFQAKSLFIKFDV